MALLLHALATVVFVNRYIGGFLLRAFRRTGWDETTDAFEPTVTVVIPLFNEGIAIQETLRSILASDYPTSKLDAICIDDCSSDDSYALACAIADPRLRVIRNPANQGKRRSINDAVRLSSAEIIVSVDSDVVIDRDAIRQLTRRFVTPQVAAVGGWVDVRNKHENWLTKMQVVKYWYAYYISRNVEKFFRRVMSVSACLAAYRRSALLELAPLLDSRAILGVPIRYGEDRYLTRQLVKAGYHTTVTLAARCRTAVPSTLAGYFSQQLRWRRSNVVDYAGGCSHVWRLNPLLAINYFALGVLLFAYPLGIFRVLGRHLFCAALLSHLTMLFWFGLYYRLRTRAWAAADRVSAFSYIPHALLMPITSGLFVVLALFTLDSGSWETRGASGSTS